MKIALLLPANVYFCPYASIYTEIFDKNQFDYNVIYWDKDGIDEIADYRFNYTINQNSSLIKKFLGYFFYSRFLKSVILKNKYDKLIVFGPQLGLFSFHFLKKHYRNNFVLDYRDISIDQKVPKKTEKLFKISSIQIISSPGFKNFLPKGFDYILSHNFIFESIQSALKNNDNIVFPKVIKILTIGAIRNYEQNIEIINTFANKKQYLLQFVGKGPSSDSIYRYVEKNNISNVSFINFYYKTEEENYVRQATFINIYYPYKLSHDIALSNRFYNALFNKKPMITTKNTVQGYYVDKYNLGVAVDSCDGLDEKIQEYIHHFRDEEYEYNRKALLHEFITDYNIFKDKLMNVLK